MSFVFDKVHEFGNTHKKDDAKLQKIKEFYNNRSTMTKKQICFDLRHRYQIPAWSLDLNRYKSQIEGRLELSESVG